MNKNNLKSLDRQKRFFPVQRLKVLIRKGDNPFQKVRGTDSKMRKFEDILP